MNPNNKPTLAMHNNYRTSVRAIGVAFGTALTALSALAADLTWTGAVSSDWNDPANWSLPQVGTASDHVME